jgi:hypothetical protein
VTVENAEALSAKGAGQLAIREVSKNVVEKFEAELVRELFSS